MALNRVTNFFGLKKSKQQTKQQFVVDEDEELPKAPVRKFSLSKTGRMRAKQYTHKTVTDGKLYQNPEPVGQEMSSGHKRNKSQDSNASDWKDEEEIDKIIGSLYDLTKSV